jgi:hypothetical protein
MEEEMNETDQEMAEYTAIIEADPYLGRGALELMFLGIVTAELNPVVYHLDHAIEHPLVIGEAWFDDYVTAALEMGSVLIVQKFGVAPASFPGRLVVFLDGATEFIPAFQVGDRLITWGEKGRDFCATDQPARASEMLAAIALAEADRLGEATH